MVAVALYWSLPVSNRCFLGSFPFLTVRFLQLPESGLGLVLYIVSGLALSRND